MQAQGPQLERNVVQALTNQTPVRDLPGVRISDVKTQPKDGFDVEFQLQSGQRRILVYGEVKPAASPKLLEQLAPWIRRMQSLRKDVAFALICPFLAPRSQAYCIENGIDFLDLAGNISINVPGAFTLQRLGMRPEPNDETSTEQPPTTNVFSGRSSRILRVLLERIKPRTLTEIANELDAETNRISRAFLTQKLNFAVSLGAISKALSSLEEQLWIRRQNSSVVVPEPRRLLLEWAEKYKERFRWRLRSSFQASNPFGKAPAEINRGLQSLLATPYVFTAAAAAVDAPFIDLDRIDIFLLPNQEDAKLRQLRQPPISQDTPKLRFIYAYDEGVFLYSARDSNFPRVSNIQAYLDLYARGGRDLKQADVLLDAAIAPRWKSA
ncbi:MAG TPA: hypothetical protein VFN26_14140 [Candidatus Acidoferrum sp.]|nr:hypothetical protein [Candidatus Acidoferrum sp.]